MSLTAALFHPFAQGTIRTLSERVYFLLLSHLFGMDPRPFRLVAFLTFVAAAVLLQLVGTRLSGSRAAGWLAAMLWTVNGALAIPFSWSSEYLELCFALFILLDVWLLLRFIDSGERRFLLAQWATFLVGFFVLELNVVYPALAAVVVFCCAPQSAKKLMRVILPMFLASVVYMGIHFWVASLPATGPYKLYWDRHIVTTLFTYVNWSFGTGWLHLVGLDYRALRMGLAIPMAAGLCAVFVSKLRQRQWTVLVFPAWFVIALAPLLPLRFHTDYEYLVVPLIGIAIWGAAAIVDGWSAGGWKRTSALLLLTIYLVVEVPVGLAVTASFHDRSIRIRDLFQRIQILTRDRPDRMVLLKGVNEETFNDVLYHRAFRLIGVDNVYVLPENQTQLRNLPSDAASFFLSPDVDRQELNGAAVFDLSGGNVTDVTAQFKSSILSSTVDLGNDLHVGQLGPTWYPREGSYRWMPKQATVTLAGPVSPSEKLYLKGYSPASAVRNGPVKLSVSAEGEFLRSVSVSQADASIDLSFELPDKLIGRPAVVVQLELDKTFRAPGDSRDLGLIFSLVEIR
jgi:hypothetical protein